MRRKNTNINATTYAASTKYLTKPGNPINSVKKAIRNGKRKINHSSHSGNVRFCMLIIPNRFAVINNLR
ncbi:MAG: hypothetical protein E7547_01165 [Ruminococcaceae bacterium]|nr:hypothetical protein [Oscillospiraceae bacterium]